MNKTDVSLLVEQESHFTDLGFIGRFLDELSSQLGASIPVIHGELREMYPAEGYIILVSRNHPKLSLDQCDTAHLKEISARLVALFVDPHHDFDLLLEPFSLAAAISSLAFVEWQGTPPDRVGARGLYGLRGACGVIGAECVDLFSSEHYCYLQSKTHMGLPHLLADYLFRLPDIRSAHTRAV
jgi:hypothetical protein